ncbi:hypothetical protein NKH80_21985 [Mesorhizobium sp. M0904]|uniref:hypothetical protein n=1 Tax=Mesorhizobium sp. M0904 TaxID=2957022 RepID=UPI003338BF62
MTQLGPPNSVEQLAVQAVHRIRCRLVSDRVKLVNQLRGLLAEHGIVIPRDITQLRRGLAEIIAGCDDGLSEMVRSPMSDLREEPAELDRRIASYDSRIRESSATASRANASARSKALGR